MLLKAHAFVIFLGTFITTGSCGRIVGGGPVKEGEIPFQVSLRRSYNGAHYCGGSLVTKRYVLTAAHCMYFNGGSMTPAKFITIVAGQLDHPITDKTVYRNCTRIIRHAKFDRNTFANDITILEVDKDFPVHSSRISTVTLRKKAISSGQCVVSGWGKTHANICGKPPSPFSRVSDFLLATEVNIVPYSKCKNQYGEDLKPSMLCAGTEEGGKDACQGDSGGPLMCNGLQTGIVSTGCGCAQAEFPGVYTDVAKFYPWIEEIIRLDYVEESTTTTSPETTRTKTTNVIDITKKPFRSDTHISTLWLPLITLPIVVLQLL